MHPSKEAQPSNPSGESTFPSPIDFSQTNLDFTLSTPGTTTTSQGPGHTLIKAEQRADGHTILSMLLTLFFSFFFLFFWGDFLGKRQSQLIGSDWIGRRTNDRTIDRSNDRLANRSIRD